MPKATLQSVFSILVSLTVIFLSGCTDPAAARAKQLKEAAELHASGEDDAALKILEALAQESPDDADILSQIGSVYEAKGDTTMASFYFEQAHQKKPDDVDLLYKTYLAQSAAGEPSGDLLETLSVKAPEAMTAPLWVQLGNYYSQTNQTQAALDAYLKGVNPDIEAPAPEISASIGNLFLKLDNKAQAERWFNLAADNDDPNALTALLGLLEIKLANKDWTGAEATIARLDKQFPGSVDASEWANARTELQRWRAAQDAMQAELAKAEAAKKAAAAAKAKAAAEAEKEQAEQAKALAAAQAPKTPETSTQAKAAKASTDIAAATTEITDGKAQVIADIEAAEAMADTPALEASEPEMSKTEAVAFDPSIAIQPAEPALSVEVSYDQQNNGATTDYTATTGTTENAGLPFVGTAEPEDSTPLLPERSVEALLADAEQATLDRDNDSAIRYYWQALGQANGRADIWNKLSQTYLANNQLPNAETTALEAIRLDPREVDYTLDYLRVAQRSKKPDQFLAELETAYDRFPRSPEIALSLARAYERIGQNTAAARSLYRRFIEIAPNHPLRGEADAALARLR